MKYIGILTAVEKEFNHIEEILENKKEMQISELSFLIGTIETSKCIVACSGIGKVNAARTTQALIDNFDIEYIINMGVAGSINNNLDIGDILIGEYIVQYDFDFTAFGHNKGYLPGIGYKIKCDAELNNSLKEKINNLREKNNKIEYGVIATGDIFCTDIEMKNEISSKFNADVVDMECGAIAQVTYLNKIPFIAIKCISDSPNGKNVKSYKDNLLYSCKKLATILKVFFKQNI